MYRDGGGSQPPHGLHRLEPARGVGPAVRAVIEPAADVPCTRVREWVQRLDLGRGHHPPVADLVCLKPRIGPNIGLQAPIGTRLTQFLPVVERIHTAGAAAVNIEAERCVRNGQK